MTQHEIIYGLHDRIRIDLLKSMLDREQLDQSQVIIIHRSHFQNPWESYTNNTNLYSHGDYKAVELVEQVLADPLNHLIRNVRNVPKSSPKRIFIIDNYQSVVGAFDREWNHNFKKAIEAIVNNDWNISIWIATGVLKPSALLMEQSLVSQFHRQLIIYKDDIKHQVQRSLCSKLTGENLGVAEKTFKSNAANKLIYDFSDNTWNTFN